MTGDRLRYKAATREILDLAPGECLFRDLIINGHRYHGLAAAVMGSDGTVSHFHIPFTPGEKQDVAAWGLRRIDSSTWQTVPSVFTLEGQRVELWHQVPFVENVPDPPPWEPTTFSWDRIQRVEGKILLLYRHRRVLEEPWFKDVRDVLDIGGWGIFAQAVIEEGRRCTILDKFTPDQYYADRVHALPHKAGDVCNAACFTSESFDLVTCFETLEHCGDWHTAIASMFLWLRRGGWVAGTVPMPGRVHADGEIGIEFIEPVALARLLETFADHVQVVTTTSIGLPGEQPSSYYFTARKR